MQSTKDSAIYEAWRLWGVITAFAWRFHIVVVGLVKLLLQRRAYSVFTAYL